MINIEILRIFALITSLSSLYIGYRLHSIAPKKKRTQLLLLYFFLLSLISFIETAIFGIDDLDIKISFVRIKMGIWTIIIFLTIPIVIHLTKIEWIIKKRWYKIIMYPPCILFTLYVLINSGRGNSMIAYLSFWNLPAEKIDLGILLYSYWSITILIAGTSLAVFAYRNIVDSEIKFQSRIIYIAGIIGVVASLLGDHLVRLTSMNFLLLYYQSHMIFIISIFFGVSFTKLLSYDVRPEIAIQKIIDSVSNFLIIVQMDHRIKQVSDVVYEEFEIKNDSIINAHLSELFSKQTFTEILPDLEKMDASDDKFKVYKELTWTYNNISKHVLTNITIIKDTNNNHVGYLITGTNISTLKEAEKKTKEYAINLENINDDLEQFSHIASHDLKEPLRMVTSYLQLLQQTESEKIIAINASDDVQHSISIAENLQRQITDVLEAANINKEQQIIETIDLTKMNQWATFAFKDANMITSTEQVFITGHNLPKSINAQAKRIKQFFIHIFLLLASKKYNDVPALNMQCNSTSSHYLFELTDNGQDAKGQQKIKYLTQLKDAKAKAVFFEQQEQLNLMICNRIIEKHGGEFNLIADGHNNYHVAFSIKKQTLNNDASDGWELALSQKELKIHLKSTDKSAIKDTKAVLIVHSPIRNVINALMSPTNYNLWVPYHMNSTVIQKESESSMIVQTTLNASWWPIIARDIVVRSKIEKNGDIIVFTETPVPDYIPELKTAKRMKEYQSKWIVQSIDEHTTQIEHNYHIGNLGSKVPDWFSKIISFEGPRRLLNNFKKHIEET